MEQDFWKYEKIPTQIPGFDKLLFGGLDVSRGHLMIVVKGERTLDKTLFGLQLIYGLSQSIDKLSSCKSEKIDEAKIPNFISANYTKDFLEDLLLDILISSYIQKLIEIRVSDPTSQKLQSDSFIQSLFETGQILNNSFGKIIGQTNSLIGEEVIYYSNRTNALHFRTMAEKDNKDNLLYTRRHNTIKEYLTNNNNLKELEKLIDAKLLPINIQQIKTRSYQYLPNKECDLFAIELGSSILCWEEIFQIKQNAKISVLIINNEIDIPDNFPDIVIQLSSKNDKKYLLHYLSIIQNNIQDFAKGWHQYKRRDYGIEVYPSLHLYFQQRRYLQRALVYTHSNVITDTYQQYLKREKFYGNEEASYENYRREITCLPNKYFTALYPDDFMDFISVDLLSKIFISINDIPKCTNFSKRTKESVKIKELLYGNSGIVTAVIGEENTYKRFITFGSIFSSSRIQEHTLILLLNREEAIIRRRLACPAKIKNRCNREECLQCYQYIHFMNFCMGYISPEEFIYFLEKQISVPFNGESKKKIKRIIIDDLQILDFCFPLLQNNSLFLSALMTLCRDNDIALYILCNKKSDLTKSLRALADNVVCMDRDSKGKALVYVERFAGYNNTPSKIYCGKIEDITELFKCYEQYNDTDEKELSFTFNEFVIEDKNVISTDIFWEK